MSTTKSYESAEGFNVFTSNFLKARGTCCKSGCLHCPYGYTLKKFGLQFDDWSEDKLGLAQNFIQESTQPQFDLQQFAPEHRKFIKLKDQICGIMFKNHIVVKAVFLGEHFRDQGLSKEMIESYYFI
jgi:hypothetical protein